MTQTPFSGQSASTGIKGQSPRQAALIFILITVTLDILSVAIVVPVIPHLVEEFTGSVNQASWMIGIFGFLWALMQFIFSPLLGSLSDRFGRRPVILLSNLGLGLDYLLLALAPSLAWMVVARLISGITSASVTVANAYIADIFPPDRRAGAFGMLGACFGIGFIIGPALGGYLGDMNPRLPFYVASGLSLANFAYGFFVLPESHPVHLREKFRWKSTNPWAAMMWLREKQGLTAMAVIQFLKNLAHSALPTVFVFYLQQRFGWSLTLIGIVLTTVGIGAVIVEGGLSGYLVRRLGAGRAMLYSIIAGVLGFALMGLAVYEWMFLLAIIPMSFWGVSRSASQAIASARVSAEDQGKLQGSLNAVIVISGMVGPLLFSWVFGATVDHSLILQGAAFMVAALALALSLPLAWVFRSEKITQATPIPTKKKTKSYEVA